MTWRLVPVPLLGKASCLGWLPAACTLTATKSICAFPYGGGLDTLKSAMHLCPFDLSLFSCSVHGPFAVMCSFKREQIWYSVKCPVVPAKPSHWIESAVLFLSSAKKNIVENKGQVIIWVCYLKLFLILQIHIVLTEWLKEGHKKMLRWNHCFKKNKKGFCCLCHCLQ